MMASGLWSAGGLADREVDNFVLRALFSTVTNVNFDAARFNAFLKEAYEMKNRAKALYEKAKTTASPSALAKALAEEQQEDQWHPTSFKFSSVRTCLTSANALVLSFPIMILTLLDFILQYRV
jgi:hydroxylamine reductase (hybrid-cluster protein)